MLITKKAAAKINILLDITSVLDNGYHAIYSIMQSVSLYDTVSVEHCNNSKIVLSCSNPAIPCDEKNTAHKAAGMFFEHCGINNSGISIHIDKKIPAQGGLAGGSADAAGVLAAMNELFETGLSAEELCRIGVKIGADVPFCLTGGTTLSQNIGDVLTSLPPLPDCNILLVKPHTNVSTLEAYQAFDKKDWIRHPNRDYALKAAVERNLSALCRYSSNVFEQVIEIPERVEIKAIMRSFDAIYTFMTGSGSVICGIFTDEGKALACESLLSQAYDEVFLTVPIQNGISD